MDSANYIILSRQIGLFNKLNVISNNMANVNNNGFQSESLIFKEHLVNNINRQVSYSNDVSTVRNLKQGEIFATGRDLDVAINGDGYFAVKTPLGTRYTRSGSFQLDPTGQLTTNAGYQVLDGSSPIAFQEGDTQISISKNGTISVKSANNIREDRGILTVLKFENQQQMRKVGSGLFTSNEVPLQADKKDYVIAAGMLEKSNVNPIKEITEMIKINRTVATTAKMLNNIHDLQRKAVSTISKQ